MPVLWPLFLLIPMIGGALTLFGVAMVRMRSHTRQAVEFAKQMDAEHFVQTGGGQLGWLYATMPFATIVVTRDRIMITVAGKRADIARASVQTIRPYGSLFSNGLRIEHAGEKAIFWSANVSGLRDAFERLDWPVER